MKIDEQIKQKLEEAIDILKKFGMPSAQQNERTEIGRASCRERV